MTPTKSYIHKLNIVRFETLLARETDASRRDTLSTLLAEEQALLGAAEQAEGKGARTPADAEHPA